MGAVLADVGAVDLDCAFGDVPEAGDEVDHGRFTGSGRAHYGYGLTLLNLEVDVAQDLALPVVGEADVLEADGMFETGERLGVSGLLDRALGREDLVDALHGRHALGDSVGRFGEVLDRLDDRVEDGHVGDEGRGVDAGMVAQDEGSAEP